MIVHNVSIRPENRLDGLDDAPGWKRLFVAAVFLGWLAIVWFWPVSVYTLTVDDSYYYLVTADNAGHGYGFTFDRLNPTNGFHPLWMLVLVPVSRLAAGNMDLFARLAMTIQLAMIYAGTSVLSRALQERNRWFPLATALLMLNFYFAKIGVNALESGLQWLCLCATLSLMLRLLEQNSSGTSAAKYFGLGMLGGLCVLSRITAVLFVGAVLLTTIVVDWQSNDRRGTLSLIVRRIIAASLGVVLLVAPYLIWNYLSTGHLMSVSAAIKTSRAYTRLMFDWVLCGAIILVVAFAFGILVRSGRYQPLTRRFIWAAFPLLVYAGLQEVSDILLRGVWVSELWYMVPQAILAALGLAFLFDRATGPSRVWRGLAWATTVGLIAFAGFTMFYRYDPTSYSGYLAARRSADWLRENSAPDAVAAGWDVGIVGGFSGRRVANLDGLINCWDYKENYFDKGKTEEWLSTTKPPVEYIVQYFWADQANPKTLGDYRGVELTKWNVVYHERVAARSWSNLGPSRDMYYLVLSRGNHGVPLSQFLEGLAAK